MMHRFRTTLVSGTKRPYTSWTFVVVPQRVAKIWGPGPKAVCGTIAGSAFRGTASRGEGCLRVPIPTAFRQSAGLICGDSVEVTLDLDTEPRRVEIPAELKAVFRNDPEVSALYGRLPPAHRRAWASFVAEAKRPETRRRRAGLAPVGIRARAFPK
jgi:hypothetical protein